MSQPPQKPGPGDLDLRARLGFKSAQPGAPTPAPSSLGGRLSPRPASAPQQEADAPSDDLFARVGQVAPPVLSGSRPSQPSVPGYPPQQPGSQPLLYGAPPLAAPPTSNPAFPASGGPLRMPPAELLAGSEEEATRPAQFSPGLSAAAGMPFAAPAPQAAPAPAGGSMDPLAFLTQAPPMRKAPEPQGLAFAPAASLPPTAPASVAPQPAAPQPPDPFASPYAPAAGVAQQPAYYPPPGGYVPAHLAPEALAMIDGPAPGLDAAGKRTWTIALGVGLAVALVVGGVAYSVGQLGRDREIRNRRIDNAAAVLQVVKQSSERLQEVTPLVAKLDPDKPDFGFAEKHKGFTSALALDEILGDHLLLGRAITTDLMKYAALATDFQEKVRRHAALTATRHRAYLEQIATANQAMQTDAAMFVFFTPNAKANQDPPQGHLVMLAGEPLREGKDIKVPVRPLTSPDIRPVDINLLVAINRDELLQSSGPNVLALHAERVAELKQLAVEIDKMKGRLIDSLSKEASKAKVATF